jgi:ATP-binding cassette subfamily B protein
MSFSPILGPEIPAFTRAETAPPRTVWAFFGWALRGAWAGIIWAAFWSVLTGSLEAVSATLLGRIIDGVAATDRGHIAQDLGPLFIVFAAYYLVIRPVIFGMNTAAASIRLEPNLFPLILSRLNRWTIGQAVTFFDNDFAGRIAQKQMQTARASTDVVAGLIETGAFAISSVVGSVLLLSAIDWRMAVVLVLWITTYYVFIRRSLTKIRGASASRAAARAMVTGQIVDTVTNMKTVKLFAHATHEDRVALAAMAGYREKAIGYGIISSWFRFILSAIAGVLPVLTISSSGWR